MVIEKYNIILNFIINNITNMKPNNSIIMSAIHKKKNNIFELNVYPEYLPINDLNLFSKNHKNNEHL